MVFATQPVAADTLSVHTSPFGTRRHKAKVSSLDFFLWLVHQRCGPVVLASQTEQMVTNGPTEVLELLNITGMLNDIQEVEFLAWMHE